MYSMEKDMNIKVTKHVNRDPNTWYLFNGKRYKY